MVCISYVDALSLSAISAPMLNSLSPPLVPHELHELGVSLSMVPGAIVSQIWSVRDHCPNEIGQALTFSEVSSAAEKERSRVAAAATSRAEPLKTKGGKCPDLRVK